MRLINIHDIGNAAYNERVFCYSTLGSLIALVVFVSLFIGCISHYIMYSLDNDVGFWETAFYFWFAFWFGLFGCFAWSRYKAGKLPSNWLLRSGSNRILIKFRSFQNYLYPDTDRVVLEFNWREIEWLRMTKETSYKPGSDGDITEYSTYLEMQLNLTDEELKLIEQGLAKERCLKPLVSKVGELKSELFRARKNKRPKHEVEEIKMRLRQEKAIKKQGNKTSVKYHDYPVSLDNKLLRIRWNGVKPNIKQTLSYLSNFSRIEEENKIETDSTVKLAGQALDDMILDRINKGDKIDAVKLAQGHYGYTKTEAKRFIDELMENQVSDENS